MKAIRPTDAIGWTSTAVLAFRSDIVFREAIQTFLPIEQELRNDRRVGVRPKNRRSNSTRPNSVTSCTGTVSGVGCNGTRRLLYRLPRLRMREEPPVSRLEFLHGRVRPHSDNHS
jgi:hypothetical protein